MFVYNITIKVENKILPEWIAWMQHEHIPEVLSHGLFTETKFFQLLDQDDSADTTFVLQYFFSNQNNYHLFISHHEKNFTKKSIEKWGDSCIDFRTTMKTVQ